jgi:hypothetical protein
MCTEHVSELYRLGPRKRRMQCVEYTCLHHLNYRLCYEPMGHKRVSDFKMAGHEITCIKLR